MSAIDRFVQANALYAERFDKSGLSAAPGRRVAVVICMDARLVPARMFGLEEGDAHVISNAGGSARDALRSLIVSQRMLGTNEVMVVHHADCGMLKVTNDELHAKVRADLNADDGGIDYLPFSDAEQSVRDDLAFLEESPLIGAKVLIRGFVYDERRGRLSEVG